jgi:hypothetical protein
MRTRQIRALCLSMILAFTLSALPATASPGRDDGDRSLPGMSKIIKRIVKFVLHPLDELFPPHP